MISRNYDIYAIEERVHNLENGGAPTPGGSWDYSTEETDTHQKWIDGKTIYCKVITGTFAFPSGNNQLSIANVSDWNMETIIDCRASDKPVGASVASCTNIMCYVESNILKGINFGFSFNASAIILLYTKTELTKSTKRSKK